MSDPATIRVNSEELSTEIRTWLRAVTPRSHEGGGGTHPRGSVPKVRFSQNWRIFQVKTLTVKTAFSEAFSEQNSEFLRVYFLCLDRLGIPLYV